MNFNEKNPTTPISDIERDKVKIALKSVFSNKNLCNLLLVSETPLCQQRVQKKIRIGSHLLNMQGIVDLLFQKSAQNVPLIVDTKWSNPKKFDVTARKLFTSYGMTQHIVYPRLYMTDNQPAAFAYLNLRGAYELSCDLLPPNKMRPIFDDDKKGVDEVVEGIAKVLDKLATGFLGEKPDLWGYCNYCKFRAHCARSRGFDEKNEE